MATWFTSDLHFGHRNILEYCDRPWTTLEDMHAGLIARWNMRVRPGDLVYVLGDFSLSTKPDFIDGWLEELNGDKILIRGNHDNRKATARVKGWKAVEEVADVTVDGVKARLFHYPIVDWPGPHLLLHGHCHGSRGAVRAGSWRRYNGVYMVDVGVDVWSYQPISIDEIMQKVRGV